MFGPVELLILTFSSPQADSAVIETITELVERGTVTMLDLLFLSRDDDGTVRVVEFGPEFDEAGLGRLSVEGGRPICENDLDVIRDGLDPGTSALVLVYEQTWLSAVTATITNSGGAVALHVQIPGHTVDGHPVDPTEPPSVSTSETHVSTG